MRRALALSTAPVLLLLLATPAGAQEAQPSPSPTLTCATVSPAPGQPAAPCRLPSPEPTSSPTCTPAPDGGPGPCEHPPSQTPSPTVSCPGLDITGVESDHRVGGVTTVTATRYGGPEPTTMTLTRVRPAPEAVVREQSDTATTVTWTLRLGETHAVQIGARFDRSRCVPLGRPDQPPVTIGIRADVSISAVRNAALDYTFSGRVVPARAQVVDLHRVTAEGRRVLTARATVRSDGSYRIDRRFTGSGRFGFVATVGTSATNLAGASSVRPTVVH